MKNYTIENLRLSIKEVINYAKIHYSEFPLTLKTRAEFIAIYNEYESIYNYLESTGVQHQELVNNVIEAMNENLFLNGEERKCVDAWWKMVIASKSIEESSISN